MKNSTILKTAITLAATLAAFTLITGCSSQQDSSSAKAAIAPAPAAQHPTPPPVEIRVSRETPTNAVPLGLEVGYANLAGAKKTLAGVAFNEIPLDNGAVKLESNGEGTGVDGISSLTLLFNSDKTLVFLSMMLPKDPKGMMAKLQGKYKVAENRIDGFMNYGNARLTKGNSVVLIESQHLSFAMEVTYTTAEFLAAIRNTQQAAKAAKQKEQNSKF